MKTKSKIVLLVISLSMIFTFACIGSTPSSVPIDPTEEPQTTESEQLPTEHIAENEGELEITSVSSYIDSFNDYNVAGEIVNNSNQTLENVTLSLSITAENGDSLLKDSDDNPVDSVEIQPYISTLVPGASSSFNYYISADEVTPAGFDVTIKSYDESSAPDLADFTIQNIQLATTMSNDILITGEVVNNSSEKVEVEAMSGALMDGSRNVLAANFTLTYPRYLYPAGDPDGRDHGPFIVRFYGPVENMEHWKVYARGVEMDDFPTAADMEVQLTNSYLDTYGTYHLLGTLTNRGTTQISPALIGGLYGPDQTVFDAASLNIPLYVNAGETVPFDINSFQLTSSMTPDQASALEKTVQPDLYWTFNTEYEVEALEAENVELAQDGFDWTVSGTVENSSKQNLASISAVVEILDENGQVMATNSTTIYPPEGSELIDPGQSNEFSVSIYVPEDWDLSANDYRVLLQGIVSE